MAPPTLNSHASDETKIPNSTSLIDNLQLPAADLDNSHLDHQGVAYLDQQDFGVESLPALAEGNAAVPSVDASNEVRIPQVTERTPNPTQFKDHHPSPGSRESIIASSSPQREKQITSSEYFNEAIYFFDRFGPPNSEASGEWEDPFIRDFLDLPPLGIAVQPSEQPDNEQDVQQQPSSLSVSQSDILQRDDLNRSLEENDFVHLSASRAGRQQTPAATFTPAERLPTTKTGSGDTFPGGKRRKVNNTHSEEGVYSRLLDSSPKTTPAKINLESAQNQSNPPSLAHPLSPLDPPVTSNGAVHLPNQHEYNFQNNRTTSKYNVDNEQNVFAASQAGNIGITRVQKENRPSKEISEASEDSQTRRRSQESVDFNTTAVKPEDERQREGHFGQQSDLEQGAGENTEPEKTSEKVRRAKRAVAAAESEPAEKSPTAATKPKASSGLRFNNFTEAFKCRNKVDWEIVKDDDVPKTDADRQALVKQLLSAIKDMRNCKDKKGHVFKNRWQEDANNPGVAQCPVYSDEQLEVVAWILENALERLYTKGPRSFDIGDKAFLEKAKKTKDMPFQERFQHVINVVSQWKCRVDNLIKGGAAELLVIDPADVLKSSEINRAANDQRQTQLNANKKNKKRKASEVAEGGDSDANNADSTGQTENQDESSPPAKKRRVGNQAENSTANSGPPQTSQANVKATPSGKQPAVSRPHMAPPAIGTHMPLPMNADVDYRFLPGGSSIPGNNQPMGHHPTLAGQPLTRSNSHFNPGVQYIHGNTQGMSHHPTTGQPLTRSYGNFNPGIQPVHGNAPVRHGPVPPTNFFASRGEYGPGAYYPGVQLQAPQFVPGTGNGNRMAPARGYVNDQNVQRRS